MAGVPKTILVADDDPDARIIVGQSLALGGYTILEAVDGTEAIRIIDEALPDLAILDVMMPGADGIQVCAHLRSKPGGELVPIMMLTARDGIRDKISAFEEGAYDYLTKPFNYQELEARIKALFRIQDLNRKLQAKNSELEAAQEKLVQSERQLVAMQLAGTAAHQLGQPLSAILLNLHLLEAIGPSDSRYGKAFEAVKQDAQRLANLLHELRSVDAAKTEVYHSGTTILGLNKGQS